MHTISLDNRTVAFSSLLLLKSQPPEEESLREVINLDMPSGVIRISDIGWDERFDTGRVITVGMFEKTDAK